MLTRITVPGGRWRLVGQGLRTWGRRQIIAAAVGTVVVGTLIGIATVLIPNPLFARDIPPVWWNYPVWIVTSVMSGMLIATFVQNADTAGTSDAGATRSSRLGTAGGVLAWFAVGCPVCNKIALLALGYSGAITWFAPIQPLLAVGALLLTAWALVARLQGLVACPVPVR